MNLIDELKLVLKNQIFEQESRFERINNKKDEIYRHEKIIAINNKEIADLKDALDAHSIHIKKLEKIINGLEGETGNASNI